MTRCEAWNLLETWIEARTEAERTSTLYDIVESNNIRERIIDAMTGEESTQPLAGNAP